MASHNFVKQRFAFGFIGVPAKYHKTCNYTLLLVFFRLLTTKFDLVVKAMLSFVDKDNNSILLPAWEVCVLPSVRLLVSSDERVLVLRHDGLVGAVPETQEDFTHQE